jgi:hypothetical protein
MNRAFHSFSSRRWSFWSRKKKASNQNSLKIWDSLLIGCFFEYECKNRTRKFYDQNRKAGTIEIMIQKFFICIYLCDIWERVIISLNCSDWMILGYEYKTRTWKSYDHWFWGIWNQSFEYNFAFISSRHLLRCCVPISSASLLPHTHTPKLSNQNAVYTRYSVLINILFYSDMKAKL